jgi:spore germination cell wall hydrolase CwlJ-like protein
MKNTAHATHVTRRTRTLFPIIIVILGIIAFLLIRYVTYITAVEAAIPELQRQQIMVIKEPTIVFEDTITIEESAEPKEPILSDDDIMAIVAMREAKGEGFIGKVAVVATILNRCDYYGETVETVVYKPNQFSFSKDTIPNDDCYKAVEIAKQQRDLFPATMLWFKADGYHTGKYYGKPYMQIGNHYFNYIPESDGK